MSESNKIEAESTAEETNSEEQNVRTWKQRLFSWAWQLVVIVFIYAGVTGWMTRTLLASGKTAPGFALQDLKGKTYRLKDFKGKQVVIHFWATWCGVCKTNIPVLKWMASSYRTNPVFLTVVQDSKNLKKILEIYRLRKLNYPVLLAQTSMLRNYRVSQFPTTYFIDRNGRVFSKDVGFISPIGFWWRTWASTIKTWLGL